MKISISNFKSIKEIRNFEINFTTLLSGVNSSGKTSFIQLLLLLKQTIEKKSINDVLVLNEPYVELGKFEDIIYNHDINNLLEIELTLDKDDMNVYKD
jgi:predicted ATPase